MNLPERIQTVLREIPTIDQVELGRAAGVSKGTVNQWLSGKIKSMKLEYAKGIQKSYGYSVDWLVLGKGPKKVADIDSDATIKASNTGVNRPLTKAAEHLIFCVMRLDAAGGQMRNVIEHHAALMSFAEESLGAQDAGHERNAAEITQLLQALAERTGSD